MASHEAINANLQGVRESAWGGGVTPFATGSKKLGMWLFIMSDAITFAALLMAYCYVRVASDNWPQPFEFYPALVKATVMTFILLSSSVTMVMAVQASKREQRASAVKWILATMAGGLLFVAIHATEWVGLIGEGVRLFHNPWGAPQFGAAFFHPYRLAHDPRLLRRHLLGRGRGLVRQGQTECGRCGSGGAVLALCGLGVDVHFSAGVCAVD